MPENKTTRQVIEEKKRNAAANLTPIPDIQPKGPAPLGAGTFSKEEVQGMIDAIWKEIGFQTSKIVSLDRKVTDVDHKPCKQFDENDVLNLIKALDADTLPNMRGAILRVQQHGIPSLITQTIRIINHLLKMGLINAK